ncbi:flagellar biosynthetic protein FliR [Stomatohabitans albus]|uniref:flagellar biosynthetic protein FliR n=1 Tax=Stomatohabitans albus TaxID=3110766 RepID=UPI00300DAB23
MDITVIAGWVLGGVLIMVRASAWMLTCPPFNNRAMPVRVRVSFALALALFLGPTIRTELVPTDIAPLLNAVVINVAVGVILGVFTNILIRAMQAAGEFIDVFGGISINPAFDPTTGQMASGFARFYGNLTTGLLFAIGGHLLLVRGFLRTFDVISPEATSMTVGNVEEVATRAILIFILAAVEIALPAIAVSFVIEIAQGLIAKAAPQMNVMLALAPLKVGVAILVTTLAFGMLPNALTNLINHGLTAGFNLFGG